MSTAFPLSLSDQDLHRLSVFIMKQCGIKMPDTKRPLLESRLQKRLRALKIPSFHEYCEHLFSEEGIRQELVHFIDMVTTNKTSFFRENSHFAYLKNRALREVLALNGAGTKRKLSVWSAGCSTGEEPYTLAFVLSEFARDLPGFDFNILATDISTRVLETAKLGIYDEDSISPIPEELRRKYLWRSRDPRKNLVRVVPEIREKVSFQRLNFMDDHYSIHRKIDVIFCRNVLIYFDRTTQEAILNKFCRYLVPGGFVFLGHSESTANIETPLVAVAPTVYRVPA